MLWEGEVVSGLTDELHRSFVSAKGYLAACPNGTAAPEKRTLRGKKTERAETTDRLSQQGSPVGWSRNCPPNVLSFFTSPWRLLIPWCFCISVRAHGKKTTTCLHSHNLICQRIVTHFVYRNRKMMHRWHRQRNFLYQCLMICKAFLRPITVELICVLSPGFCWWKRDDLICGCIPTSVARIFQPPTLS